MVLLFFPSPWEREPEGRRAAVRAVSVSLPFPRAVGAVTSDQSARAESIDTENRTRSVGVVFQFLFLFTVPAGSK